MSKYIVTWTEKFQAYNNYYSPGNRNIEPEYYTSSRNCYEALSDDKELEAFVLRNNSSISDVRYFLLDKEIYPKLQVSVQL